MTPDPRSPEERAKVSAMIADAQARLSAEIEERRQREREERIGGAGGPPALGDDRLIIAAERAYWERRLNELDPLIQAELRRLRGQVATLEARMDEVAKELKQMRAGQNGRAPANPPKRK